MERKEPS
jgi:hypothetical protein